MTPHVKAGSRSVRRLISDLSSGRITDSKAGRIAARLVARQYGFSRKSVPRRYHGTLGRIDIEALSVLAARASAQVVPAGVPEAGAGESGCVPLGLECYADSAHFEFLWDPASLTKDQLADVDGSGVPDQVEKSLDVMEKAWAFFQDQLHMIGPTDTVTVWWGNPVESAITDRGASLGLDLIFMPADYDTAYLPVHELFHQFQWHYLMAATVVIPNMLPNLLLINWWMEATAEWATTQYALSTDHTTTNAQDVPESKHLLDFFSTTDKALSYGDFTNGFRQYGAVAAVQLLTEWFGQDFVTYSWQSVGGKSVLDGVSQLDDALARLDDGDMAGTLPSLWLSLYTTCDPATAASGAQSSVFESWCAAHVVNELGLKTETQPAGSVARPVHSASSSRRDSHTFAQLGAGGAVFQDIATPESGIGAPLQITVDAADASHLAVFAYAWGSSPGDWCASDNTFDGSYGTTGATELSTKIVAPSECPNVTVMITDTQVTHHDDQAVTVGWRTKATGAVITNGTISLGVSSTGSLYNQHAADGTPVGLMDNASGGDGLASVTHADSWLFFLQDETGALDGRAGSYLSQEAIPRDPSVVDFWATSSEAASIVQVGPIELVQYYHPSSNPHAYQLDVSVRTDQDIPIAADTETIVYRRTIATPVYGNYDEALPSYVTVGHDPAQTEVAGYTNSGSGIGTIGDSQLLTPVDIATLDAWETHSQAMGIDLYLTPTSPQITLYIGAAPEADAPRVVNSLNAGTYLLSTPPSEENTDPRLTVILAH
ncbi:MAG: hypothetical protein QM779_11475 [Propionicimonas sp.]|uniref:hypothetical protein n=1 Tax=Propionicimonas sp. TaxID=1955623 RepID=UPI003D0AF6B8